MSMKKRLYYIVLALKNALRSQRYTLPLFLVFALTVSLALVTDNAKTAGEELKRSIGEKYEVAVELEFSPPLTLSGARPDDLPRQRITWEDIVATRALEQVKTFSCSFDFQKRTFYVWEMDFDTSLLEKVEEGEDLSISGSENLRTLTFRVVKNSKYQIRSLSTGSHIEDGKTGPRDVIISSWLAETRGISVGDSISFPLEKIDDPGSPLADSFNVVGIEENNGMSIIYIPFECVEEFMNSVDYAEMIISDVHFIMKSPEVAESFIVEALPRYAEREYAMEANDYDYKREVYSVETMIELNSAMNLASLITGSILLLIILIKSALIRGKDIAIMRYLSCRGKDIFTVFYIEKLAVMLAGTVFGFALAPMLSRLYNNINNIDSSGFILTWEIFLYIGIIYLISALALYVIYRYAMKKRVQEIG